MTSSQKKRLQESVEKLENLTVSQAEAGQRAVPSKPNDLTEKQNDVAEGRKNLAKSASASKVSTVTEAEEMQRTLTKSSSESKMGDAQYTIHIQECKECRYV